MGKYFGSLFMLRTYTIVCKNKCGAGEDWARSDLTRKKAEEYFIKDGWKKIKGCWYCKDCAKSF